MHLQPSVFLVSRFKRASLSDLDDITSIVEKAKEYLKKDHLTQWQSGKPNRETLKASILNKTCFVLEVDGYIAGTINLSQEPDPFYTDIDGQWQNPKMPYLTIHTLAVDPLYQGEGLGKLLINHAIQYALDEKLSQLRIDTHKDNFRMIQLLQSKEFEYAGIVEVDDPLDPKRNAYQYFMKTF